jgi:hypothetical protein
MHPRQQAQEPGKIDEFIHYMAHHDKTFPSRIKGATPNEITKFKLITGCELPPDYRAFLRAMGRSTGGVPLLNDGTSDICQLIEYYRAVRQEQEEPAPDGCLAIAIMGKSIPEVYLKMNGAEAGEICWGEDPGNWGAMARSLYDRLFQAAFLYIYMDSTRPVFTHASRYFSKKSIPLERVARYVRDLGFSIAEWSDRFNLCADRKDAVIAAQQWEQGTLSLVVAAQSDSEAVTIGHELAEAFELRMSKAKAKA